MDSFPTHLRLGMDFPLCRAGEMQPRMSSSSSRFSDVEPAARPVKNNDYQLIIEKQEVAVSVSPLLFRL